MAAGRASKLRAAQMGKGIRECPAQLWIDSPVVRLDDYPECCVTDHLTSRSSQGAFKERSRVYARGFEYAIAQFLARVWRSMVRQTIVAFNLMNQSCKPLTMAK